MVESVSVLKGAGVESGVKGTSACENRSEISLNICAHDELLWLGTDKKGFTQILRQLHPFGIEEIVFEVVVRVLDKTSHLWIKFPYVY